MTIDRPYVILVNGPNLNRLGMRDPDVYGSVTLAEVESNVAAFVAHHGVALKAFQSNHEGELIDFLQTHGPEAIGVIINPGALTHYGLSLRDCIEDIRRPCVEVHISNIHRREAFRHQSVIAPVAVGQIVGLGTTGYELAAQFLMTRYSTKEGNR